MTRGTARLEFSLLALPDVTSGLINAIYANGASFTKPEELLDAPLGATYESSVGQRSVMRDVLKYYVRDGRNLECIFGFELQSSPHAFMPVRVLGYNGATYRDELGNRSLLERYGLGVKRVAPVFTAILYFGAKRWRRNLRLSDRATMSEDVARIMAPYFDDFQIRVVDFAGMTDEELSVFPVDIRIISEYFRAKRLGTEYVPSNLEMVHKRQVCDFMKYVARDSRFDYDEIMEGYEEEPENMCEVLDRIIDKRVGEVRREEREEREKIRKEERRKGREEERKVSAAKLRNEGWSDEKIARFYDVDVVDVRIWLDSTTE